ncbi:MAG: EH signature domain-containing protein [Motiliproteus sp.]
MHISRAIESFGMEALQETPSLQKSLLKLTAERVSTQLFFTELREPDSKSVLEVYWTLLRLYSAEKSLEKLPSRFVSISPWAILIPLVDGHEELATLPGFLDLYFKFLHERTPRSVLPPLVHVFLFYYPVEKRYFSQLREGTLALFDVISSLRVNKLREGIKSSGVMSEKGHLQLVSDMNQTSSISQTLQLYRLTGALEKGQFTEFCMGHYLAGVGALLYGRTEPRQLDLIDNLLGFVSDSKELEFPSLRVQIADALLSPFQHQMAHKSVQEKLKDFFVQVYGDPRLNPARWVGVSEESMATMRQWLVEDTLEDFFKLLSHVAQNDAMADRHWAYRKRFWQAYLRKGFISEAWVALGPNARAAASEFLGDKKSQYASLRAPDRKHSALMMKIGDLVITEWSHSGSYRAWHESNNPPHFYRSRYTRDDLIRLPDYQGAHQGSENGTWQRKLYHIIQHNTGLNVSYSRFMHD